MELQKFFALDLKHFSLAIGQKVALEHIGEDLQPVGVLERQPWTLNFDVAVLL